MAIFVKMIKCKQSGDLHEPRNMLTPDNCTIGSRHGYPLLLIWLVHYHIFKFIVSLLFISCV